MLPVRDPVRLLAPGSDASPELRDSLQALRTALPSTHQLDSLAARLTLAGAPVSFEGSGIVPKARLPLTQAAGLKAAAAVAAAVGGVALAVYLTTSAAGPGAASGVAVRGPSAPAAPSEPAPSVRTARGGAWSPGSPGARRHLDDAAGVTHGEPAEGASDEADAHGASGDTPRGTGQPGDAPHSTMSPAPGGPNDGRALGPGFAGPGVGGPGPGSSESTSATAPGTRDLSRRNSELAAHSDESVSEPELLRRARAALGGSPVKTLELADVHRRRFPAGVMVQEREYLAITALVRLGRISAAEARASSFRRSFPGSPYERQLRSMLPGVFAEP